MSGVQVAGRGKSQLSNFRLVYAVVARGITPLAEYTSTSGNFPSVSRVLLGKIQTSDQARMSYVYDAYAFHYVAEAGIIYMCLTEEQFPRRLAFAFLEDIKERFKATYPREAMIEATSLGFNDGFARVLRKQIDFYADPTRSAASYVNRAWMSTNSNQPSQGPAMANVEKLLRRGEKIELLVEGDESTASQDQNGRSSRGMSTLRLDSRNARPRGGPLSHLRSVRGLFLLFVVIVVLVVSIVSSVCGGLSLPECQ